jgi:hypothetical protein
VPEKLGPYSETLDNAVGFVIYIKYTIVFLKNELIKPVKVVFLYDMKIE